MTLYNIINMIEFIKFYVLKKVRSVQDKITIRITYIFIKEILW
jgi:hypothetical protein